MNSIVTYVFIDLETTGLPKYESNKTKITELSMVAVQRRHVLDTVGLPRVKHKLTLCFNPGRMVDPVSTETTGLCNDLLEYEPYFNLKTCEMINSFLSNLQQPVCVIAHNGDSFDFPILKNHFEKFKSCFGKDIMCADSLHCFHDIIILEESNNSKSDIDLGIERELSNAVIKREGLINQTFEEHSNDKDNVNKETNVIQSISEELAEQKIMQMKNESTPKKNKVVTEYFHRPNKVRKRLLWRKGPKPRKSYKLGEIYKRVVGCEPLNAHQAENDCIMALQVAVGLKEQFVEWVDRNCYPFSEIKAMTFGIPM